VATRSSINVSVRLQPKVVATLNKVTAAHKTTQAKVVQRLIEYFAVQSRELQNTVLSGVAAGELPKISGELHLISNALQLIEWGDHAFRGEFWPWAIETYSTLDELSTGAAGLQRLARFKLGYAWRRFGMALRREGLLLPQPALHLRRRYYDAASWSQCVAIGYYRAYQRGIEQTQTVHPINLYNEACSWTLIAQYLAERDASKESLDSIIVGVQSEQQSGAEEYEPPLPETKPLPLASQSALRYALDELGRIRAVYGKSEVEGLPASQTQWIFRQATKDSDLAMLRQYQNPAYKDWLDSRRAEASSLESYTVCRRYVDSTIPIPDFDFLDKNGSLD
jgi:hypothetical protein